MSIKAPREVNPWQEGFAPPARCPYCRRISQEPVLILFYTGKRDQYQNHLYKCSSCNNIIGAPTNYAICKHYDIELEKDVFYTPCVKCPIRATDKTHGVCIWFQLMPVNELNAADRIADSIKKFSKFKGLPEV